MTVTKDGAFRILVSYAVAAAILMCALFPSYADSQGADRIIRIGLYYNTTSVSTFQASSATGIQLGLSKDGTISPLCAGNPINSVLIRKDAWYTQTDVLSFKESVQLSGNPPNNATLGPYHIQVGGDCPDYNTAILMLQDAKQKGVVLYPAYAGAGIWQLWTGFYTSSDIAAADIAKTIQQYLGQIDCKVVMPDSLRIVVMNPSGEVMLMFAAAGGYLNIHPADGGNPSLIMLNKKQYRGDLEVRRISGSDMTVINVLPLEQYLYGVVPSEIESYSPMEALKAQAVAARTYTLDNLGLHAIWGFDLCPTITCQVYNGYNSETKATNSAVDDTKGKCVTYNGKLAQVFYFASSGGITEDVSNVWLSSIPYLKSVDDKYESGKSSNYTWKEMITAADIKKWMNARDYNMGDILSVEVTKTAPSGRVTELTVKGSKNTHVYTKNFCETAFGLKSQWYTISSDADVTVGGGSGTNVETQLGGSKVMAASGLAPLQSTAGKVSVLGGSGVKASVPIIPTQYTFNGRGWGHAVGMSQEGAKGMAAAGFTYEQILGHYFPGTKVE